jgi:hypothetical protein
MERRRPTEPPAVTDAKRLILTAVMYGTDQSCINDIVLSGPCMRIVNGAKAYRDTALAAMTVENITDALRPFYQPQHITDVKEQVPEVFKAINKYLLEADRYSQI